MNSSAKLYTSTHDHDTLKEEGIPSMLNLNINLDYESPNHDHDILSNIKDVNAITDYNESNVSHVVNYE